MNILQIIALATEVADDEVNRRFAADEKPLTPVEYGAIVSRGMMIVFEGSSDPIFQSYGEKMRKATTAKIEKE